MNEAAEPTLSGLFVTGTDTGVGKTYIASLLARALCEAGVNVGAYKPVCSGATPSDAGLAWDDVRELASAIGQRFPDDRICPQRFEAPLAPPVAAALEGRVVDRGLLVSGALWWRGNADVLLVEGAGGLLSPLADHFTCADLARELGFPLLVVAADRLGAINQTLLTVEVAQGRGLPVLGVVLNRQHGGSDPAQDENLRRIQDLCGAPVLGHVEFQGRDVLLPSGERARIERWATTSAKAPSAGTPGAA